MGFEFDLRFFGAKVEERGAGLRR
ncbi:uncharacterized protein G2W53_003451 [Senna tora]|uniref:Uncharacterized protein n=1 Tax=Senna tora TaxID=362788 RepID=A0A834XDJ6_9FABA|nr:uncharacterized protein G2W53_003451 [Senna tora]